MKVDGKNYIDVTVVCLIIATILIIISTYIIPKQIGHPTYEIHMYDANGLIVGSPVYLSGHAVGHVTKVKLDDNQAFIKFVLEDKVIKKLPPNCELSIKSAGMAGSRSIDIYQFPTKQDMDLRVRETIRQTKVNEVQVAMSKQVINSANSMSTMLPETKLKELKYFMENGVVTERYVTIFDKIINSENNIQVKVGSKLKSINHKLEKHSKIKDILQKPKTE